jgi:acyl-CoA synthetase (AMP-forming)/AMP-acid ligase II
MTNLSLNLTESASRYPDAAALRCANVTTTYSMLADDVARFADYLIDGGLGPGDRVGVMLPNGAAFAVVFYGVLRAGGVVVPMSPSLSFRAVEFDSTVTDARILFYAGRRAVATDIAAVTAGTQPVRVGKHGIASLTAGFAGRTGPVDRAEDDIAVTLYDSGERRVFQRSPNSPTPTSPVMGLSSRAACSTLGPMTSCWDVCHCLRVTGCRVVCWRRSPQGRRWYCCRGSTRVERWK